MRQNTSFLYCLVEFSETREITHICTVTAQPHHRWITHPDTAVFTCMADWTTSAKMISMEGFSEMLKEKTLPLEWFGLYLQSNIENIPSNYRRNNYSLLYNELIEESFQNLEKIKNDDSLNIIYNKIINNYYLLINNR